MTADDYVTTTDLARSLDCKPAVVRRWLRDCEPVKVVGHIKYYRRSGIADVLRRCESYRVSRLIMDGAPPEEFRDSWVEYKVVERILGLAPKQIEVLIRRGGPVWRFQRNRHFLLGPWIDIANRVESVRYEVPRVVVLEPEQVDDPDVGRCGYFQCGARVSGGSRLGLCAVHEESARRLLCWAA